MCRVVNIIPPFSGMRITMQKKCFIFKRTTGTSDPINFATSFQWFYWHLGQQIQRISHVHQIQRQWYIYDVNTRQIWSCATQRKRHKFSDAGAVFCGDQKGDPVAVFVTEDVRAYSSTRLPFYKQCSGDNRVPRLRWVTWRTSRSKRDRRQVEGH